jgi:hypothetical protein
MGSVRTVGLVATSKKHRLAPERIETQDARFAASTLRRFVDAIRAGREIPNRNKIHRHFYKRAKIIKQMSEKGAKAWASLQVEDLRRTAVAELETELNGSTEASSPA